jgi:murein DD-endopeptidase MepM/ murein hydrolase activator NlpD
VTKKPFGIHIKPQTSPVQPERFQGYHTGTDFEIFPEEIDAEIPVHAICSGKLLVKKSASGYGGVAVESCEMEKSPIMVIYGHLKLTSISAKIGDPISIGDTIGILGKGYSAETDRERKHLHLGFHRGTTVNIRGYVSAKSELSSWIDSCAYVCFN